MTPPRIVRRLVMGGAAAFCGEPRRFGMKLAANPRYVTCPACRKKHAGVKRSARARAAAVLG